MRVMVSGVLASSLLVLGLPALAGPAAGSDVSVAAAPEPASVDEIEVPTLETEGVPEPDEPVAALGARRTSEFAMVGVTWDGDAHDLAVQLRLRTDGAWQDWQDLEVDHHEGEPGERSGTEPLWVGEADGVAVRATSPDGTTPDGLEVVTIDPGTAPADATATPALAPVGDPTRAAAVADGSPRIVPRPAIIKRSAWGARGASSCDSPRVGLSTRGVVLHHTAGSNSYSKGQAASIVRATQAYHMQGRDWCDIGYNFLVDKYGQVFEGRAGGTDRAVRAAHSGNAEVNERTMGVSMMGTFTGTEPSAALKTAVVRLVGWRVTSGYVPVRGTYGIGGKKLHRIAGHRNVVGTACPGGRGYAWLTGSGGLRDRVAAYVADHDTGARRLQARLGADRTGPVTRAEQGGTVYRSVQLQKADIFHRDSVGSFHVNGKIRTEYRRLGSQKGKLRWPRSNRANTGVAGVTVQRFDEGDVYQVPTGGGRAYGIWGPLADEYTARGGPRGALGPPRSSVITKPSGSTEIKLARGSIKRTKAGDIIVSTS